MTLSATNPPTAGTCKNFHTTDIGDINSYLTPQAESSHTDVQMCIPLDCHCRLCPLLASTGPTSSRASAAHNGVLLVIFLDLKQREEQGISGVKDRLSNQKSLLFMSVLLAGRNRLVAGLSEGAVGHSVYRADEH